MNKTEFVQEISRKHGLPRNRVHEFVDAFTDTLCSLMRDGKSVKIVGFGEFTVKKRAARTGRNPRTNEVVNIPAQIKPMFKPGKNMIDAVRGEG